MQPSSSVVRSRSQLTLTNHSIRSSGDSESIGPHPQSNPASSSAPRNFLRRVTLSLARTVLCCSSPSSSLSRGRKEHGGSLSRRRQTCSRRRKFGYRETRSATRCWLEGPSSSVNCEIELNPCFDHFEGQLFHRRLVNSASSTGFRASSSLLFNQQSDSVTGALGSIRGERGAWRAMGQSGSSDINANISESSLVHLTRSQLSLRSSARDGSSCVSGSRGGSEVCLSGGSIPSVYDCPVSFCEYTVQGPQTPHVLPCGHSLCQECTLKLVNAASLNNLSFSANPAGVLASLGHSKEAKCPFCRRPLPTQKNAISINYALLAVLDQYLNASSKCRKLTNGEQMTLTEDIANPAKNENCEQIIVNTDTMMNSRKVETLRSSTHAALKRLRVSHQQYESTADICQTESQTASLNRGEDQTSNMSMRTLNKDGSSCVSGSRGGSEVCLSGGSIPSVYDCPVCFCEYTMQGPQTPHVLPCGHSLCQECTLKLVNAASLNNLSFSANPAGVLASLGHSKEAKCPFCRRPLPTQKNAISINYALLAVLDQYLNASSKCRKLTNGEQMTLTEDIANPAKNENCEQIIVNTDTMMNSRKVETLRSSTHAALKRLRVSHQQYESTADICQTESQTASLNRGEDQTSNMSMRTNDGRRASCLFTGNQIGNPPMILDPRDIEIHRPQTRLDEPVRMSRGSNGVCKRLLGPSKSASILCEQSSSVGSSRGYLSSASSSTKLTPPVVPPKMPLNYDFIQAGENIPCSRRPPHITASAVSLSKND